MGVRFHLGAYRRLLSVQIRSQMQFRTAFLVDVFAAGLITILEFASIALIFDRFGDFQGWTLGEVAFLYGMVEMGFGLMDMIFSGFDPADFGRQVRLGKFDQLLLRPVNITIQVLGSKFFLRRLGKVFLGVAIFVWSLTLTDIHWTPGKLLYLPLVLFGMVAFFGGLFIIGATITFWTIESIEAVNVFTYGGQYMISFPMHIYQNWLRRFFTFVLPAIFLNYYPALYFLDKPDPYRYPSLAHYLAPVVGLLLLAVALAFWRIGLRAYQSTGT